MTELRNRRACAKPDLPPGRAFHAVLSHKWEVTVMGGSANRKGRFRPPEVGLGACAPRPAWGTLA